MAWKKIRVGKEEFEIPSFQRWAVIFGIVALVVIIALFMSFYTVGADEEGVIQRFGRYVRTTEPGLHFKVPFGVETLKKVKVQRVLKQEFGFRTIRAGVRSQYSQQDYSGESLMLTGDLNSAVVEWIVQYKIKDPFQFLFNVRNAEETLRDISESVMRLVVGDNSVDEVIVLSRQEIEIQAQELTQQLLDEFKIGLEVVTIKLQNVNPPVPVQPAFNEVNEARQEKERITNEALEAYNKVIPQAKGQAEQTVRRAEGYATNRVNRAKGDAERFMAVLREYSKAKEVTRRRIYLETMLEVLPKLEDVYIIDEEQKGLIPLLQFSKKEGLK